MTPSPPPFLLLDEKQQLLMMMMRACKALSFPFSIAAPHCQKLAHPLPPFWVVGRSSGGSGRGSRRSETARGRLLQASLESARFFPAAKERKKGLLSLLCCQFEGLSSHSPPTKLPSIRYNLNATGSSPCAGNARLRRATPQPLLRPLTQLLRRAHYLDSQDLDSFASLFATSNYSRRPVLRHSSTAPNVMPFYRHFFSPWMTSASS